MAEPSPACKGTEREWRTGSLACLLCEELLSILLRASARSEFHDGILDSQLKEWSLLQQAFVSLKLEDRSSASVTYGQIMLRKDMLEAILQKGLVDSGGSSAKVARSHGGVAPALEQSSDAGSGSAGGGRGPLAKQIKRESVGASASIAISSRVGTFAPE